VHAAGPHMAGSWLVQQAPGQQQQQQPRCCEASATLHGRRQVQQLVWLQATACGWRFGSSKSSSWQPQQVWAELNNECRWLLSLLLGIAGS
jgi:hypothetical protein